ncbi:protein bmh2 [Moniliophthora roreri MCA 2997]|uniref:Protein bmh2 n=2 Tax=Moniliophthora roreri TaxID=221103 RepID=V2XV00_MONRO|nr:protein bmh2 [Moniliophthora roreri MCA 2997]
MSPVATASAKFSKRTELLFIAELAGEAERYEDVILQIKAIIDKFGPRLTTDERNLLSVAYKNMTNNLRNSWRIVDTLGKMQAARSPTMTRQVSLIRRQRTKIEKELADVCRDIVQLVDKKLLPAADSGEERVFYSKMKGDYYRYLAEFCSPQDFDRYAEESLAAYKSAYRHALSTLEPIHPTRLGLALNFAVFYHDVRKSPDRACHLAKSAFDDAVLSPQATDPELTQTIRDALQILQLLKDDLILWSKEIQDAEA